MSNALITREPVINKQYKITANRLIMHAASVAQAVESLQSLDTSPELERAHVHAVHRAMTLLMAFHERLPGFFGDLAEKRREEAGRFSL